MKKFEVVLQSGERLVVEGDEVSIDTSGTLYINLCDPRSVVAAFPCYSWTRFVAVKEQSE